jgi:hypothetical protein
MAQAKTFKATGPTTIAFETGGDGTRIDNGVVVSGNQCGVSGTGLGGPNTIGDICGVLGESSVGFGVKGLSQGSFAAVRGEGRNAIGVEGISGPSIGVRGESTDNDGIVGLSRGDRKSGVFGDSERGKGGSGVTGRTASAEGFGVFGFSDAGGIGVKGFSNSNDGIVGVSSGDRKSGVFGDYVNKERDGSGVTGRTVSPRGSGVFGFSDAGGIGVRGFSNSNDGVLGFSDNGYGGHFRGGRAPLRLQPATESGHPTTGNHQRGELYVDGKGDLFFCKDDGTPGIWFRVQLTPA